MSVKAIPDGYTSVTPYLYVHDGKAAIQFYTEAFGAKEVMRLEMPNGVIAHAELEIGNARLMLAQEQAEWGNTSPRTLNGTSCGFCIYLENVESAFAHAIACGAEIMRPIADQFYGDRSGTLTDPFGHVWTLSTHTEDLSPEDMQKRMDEWMQSQAK